MRLGEAEQPSGEGVVGVGDGAGDVERVDPGREASADEADQLALVGVEGLQPVDPVDLLDEANGGGTMRLHRVTSLRHLCVGLTIWINDQTTSSARPPGPGCAVVSSDGPAAITRGSLGCSLGSSSAREASIRGIVSNPVRAT